MYNEKIVGANSIVMNNLPNNVEIRDYEDTINNIKSWMKIFHK